MFSLFYSKLLPRCCYFSNAMLKLCITQNHRFLKKTTDDAINERNLRESSYLFVECLPSNNSKNSRMPAEICASVLFYRECFIATKRFFIQAVENCFSPELSTDRRRRSEHLNNGFKAGQCSLVGSVSRAVETPLVAPDVSVFRAVLSQSCLSHDHDQPYTAQHCHRAKSPMGGETSTICLSPSLTQMQTLSHILLVRRSSHRRVVLILKSI